MSNEIKERFRERKFSYAIKRKKDKEEVNDDKIKKIIKIIFFYPFIFIGNISSSIIKSNKNNCEYEEPKKFFYDENINKKNLKKSVKSFKNDFENEKKYENLKKNIFKSNDNGSKIKNYNDIDIVNNNLEKKIFLKFKKELFKIKNECEIIESEEYLITKYENDCDIYVKAQEINKKITILLNKLDKIGKEYDLIKNLNFIDNPLLLDDSILIDDIIAYKERIKNNDFNEIPNKIKVLNEYVYLYEKVDKLEEEIWKIKEISDMRVNELLNRDEKYKQAHKKIVNLNNVQSCCDLIIEKNNKYLDELSKKVDNIDERVFAQKKIKGMDGFLSSSLRYLGLLALTPLRGLLPSIGAKTVATRKLLNGMLKNMHYEKVEKTVYSLSNYEHEINNKIYDVNCVEDNIKYALDDVAKLKKEFKDSFIKYDLEEYDNAYKKIILIENNIKSSQEKVEIIKQNLIMNKKINKNALIKVKKLNEKK